MKYSNLPPFIMLAFAAAACDAPAEPDRPAGALEPVSAGADAETAGSPLLEHALEWVDETWEKTFDPDIWLDACQFHEPALQDLLAAEAMLVPVAYFQDNKDGTFAVSTAPFTTAGSLNLAPSSLFYGQQRTYYGRSGVLVGPDLVATAPHTDVFDYANFKVVFGLSSRLVNGVCVQPDWSRVPEENIYDPVEVVANTHSSGAYPHDYAFLRLDRATDRKPVRVRRSGRAAEGDRLVAVGHPRRLSTKISPQGEALGWDPARGVLMNGLHLLDGSSGSMVYNADAQVLEAVVRSGLCGVFEQLPDALWQLVPLCPTSPRAVNRPIAEIVDEAGLPATSLVVGPLDEVAHTAAAGATPTAPVTYYTLRAPDDAAGPVQWQIVAPPGPSAQPKLILEPAQTSGALAPGQTHTFKATATSATQCGEFERAIQVNDVTYGYTDTIRHRFEVGLRRFAVTPADEFVVESIDGPFAKPSRTYMIVNPNPAPVKVRVEAPMWVDLKLTQGIFSSHHEGTATVELPGSASKLSSAAVTVSLDGAMAAAMIPHHTQEGELSFKFEDGQGSAACLVPSNTTRSIRFTPGKESFQALTEGLHFPGHATPYEDELVVPDPFSIDALSVDIGIFALYGGDFSDLRITLVSPGGQELPLWDENDLPNPDYYRDEIITDFGYELPIGVLHIDDAKTPSPLGTELGVLTGSSGHGVWKLRVSAAPTSALLVNWRLHFFGTPIGGTIYPPPPLTE